jgi:plasmid stabilization system protein ParE
VKPVRFTPLAEVDIGAIVQFIAREHGPDRADDVLSHILDATERLAERPGIGHTRADLTDEKVLFWPIRGFLVVYRRQRPLEIVRVLSGRRDVARLLRRKHSDG